MLSFESMHAYNVVTYGLKCLAGQLLTECPIDTQLVFGSELIFFGCIVIKVIYHNVVATCIIFYPIRYAFVLI